MRFRHQSLTIALHWISVLLLAGGVGCVVVREWVDDRSLRLLLLDLHRNAGLLLMVLAGLRLGLRAARRAGRLDHRLPTGLRHLSGLSHGMLYLGLLSIPLLGWALSSARGQSPRVLGMLPLPSLVGRDRDLAELLERWHANLAWALLVLIGMHAVAALWHHYVRKDGVLRSMLPHGRPSPPIT